MPTAAEIRESAEQASTRLRAFASRSMQQVRSMASRGADCVQHRVIAFSESCRGLKSDREAQHWSTSERNSQARDSSKDNEFGGKRLKSACATTKERCRESVRACFSIISRGLCSRFVGVVARVTNNKTVSLKAETESHFTSNN